MAFIGSNVVYEASALSGTVNKPVGVVDGHFMFALCALDANGTAGAVSWSGPAGWDLVFDEFNGAGSPDRQGALFTRVASSEPADYTFTQDGTADNLEVSICAYSDVSGLDVVYSNALHHNYTANTLNPTNSPITTVTDAATVVAMLFAADNDITAGGPPAGYALRVDGSFGAIGADDVQQVIADIVVPTAGVEAPGAWTNSGVSTAQDNDVWTIALRPSAPAETITSVDGDDITVDAQSSVAVIVSGFGSDITAITYTDGTYSTASFAQSGTGDNYTVDLPDVSSFAIDTTGVPFSSAVHSIECEAFDGSATAALAVTHNPKTGWAIVDVVSAVTGPGSIFESVFADNSQIYYGTSDNTSISASGVYTTDAETITGVVWDIDTGLWEPFTVNVTPACITINNVTVIA